MARKKNIEYVPETPSRVEGDEACYASYVETVCDGRVPEYPVSALEGGFAWLMHWQLYPVFRKGWEARANN